MSKQCRILAVDDDPLNVSILEDLLEDYDLCTATSGEEALALARSCTPDLVLLDIMMPGMDGYEVCRQLRQDERLAGVKVILVSAKAGVDERLKGYAAGADDYVVKPFDCEELLAKIRVYLRLRSMEEVDQLKSSMLRLLRHEMRTPITGMISGLEILADACPEDPAQRKSMVRLVLKNVRRLHHLVEKVVQLSALEAGEYSFQREVNELSELVNDAVDARSAQATERNVTLVVAGDDAFPVHVDGQAMGQVIGDLLDNAIRFSPDGGAVEIGAKADSGEVSLAVRDHGKGIARACLPSLFTGFSDSDAPHHTNGTGLSLAIARQIVQQHEGRIHVESEPDHGCCFTVVLPLAGGDRVPSASASEVAQVSDVGSPN